MWRVTCFQVHKPLLNRGLFESYLDQLVTRTHFCTLVQHRRIVFYKAHLNTRVKSRTENPGILRFLRWKKLSLRLRSIERSNPNAF